MKTLDTIIVLNAKGIVLYEEFVIKKLCQD